jgi:hypothetical protein
LAEIDLINGVAGHYEPYIQRTMLLANLQTIQEALNFLRRLETLERVEFGRGREEVVSHQESGGHQTRRQNRNHYINERGGQNRSYVRNVNFHSNSPQRGRQHYVRNYQGSDRQQRQDGGAHAHQSLKTPHARGLNPEAQAYNINHVRARTDGITEGSNGQGNETQMM